MNFFKSLILSAVLLFTFSAAHARRTIEYRDIQLEISCNKNLKYAIAVLDKREVVTKQSQGPDMVGYIRSATAIAYPIFTKSGNPFAEDVALTLLNSMQKSGAIVYSVPTLFTMNETEVMEKLKATGADRLILLTIDEWRNDTRSRFADVATVMVWNLSVQIFDKQGGKMVENNEVGRTDGEDPSAFSSVSKIKSVTDRYYKEKMELLFGKQSIIENLI